ncbi:7809_t:CDS:10 [Acaulospora morrowiae]|uniref:RNA-dependent RNA polymerase n=1 Tax=Acaulospora morrowiae TaxID=94023 RepID=A0A9N9GFH8_9GLOM|nr:7809_t:CDS:10 [Acaulospora morrowiae]
MNENQLKELYIGNLPYSANAKNVADAIESYFFNCSDRQCKVYRCELRSKGEFRNKGFGFISLRPNDADDLLGFAHDTPPELMRRTLNIQESRNPRQMDMENLLMEEEKFQVASLELGNWAGQHPVTEGKKEKWTFTNRWNYPHNELTLTVSESERSFLLDGFADSNTASESEMSFLDLFEVSLNDKKKRVKIPFNLLDGREGVLFDSREDEFSVYLSLKHPPMLYRKENFLELLSSQRTRFLYESYVSEQFKRTFDWTGTLKVFGISRVYRLVFKENVREIKELLRKTTIRGVPKTIPRAKVITKKATELSSTYLSHAFETLPFMLSFKLECLLSYGIVTYDEIHDHHIVDRLIELVDEGKETIAWYALNQVATKHWDPSDEYYSQRPIDIFNVAIRNFRGEYNEWHPANPKISRRNTNRWAWVNHTIITPTSEYFDDPTYEPSNRILRQYDKHIDRFMRVSFRDEDLDRLFVSEKDHDLYRERIGSIMSNGFHVAGRHYEFLAFSSSQLREASCWFVSADGDFNADMIRSRMGDFSSIMAPALYAARMGQCFSSTVATIELDEDQVEQIPDIWNNGCNFSDGCGTISESLAKRVAKLYWGSQWKRDKEVPSVFQIRYGGTKGVVSVDRRLEEDVLCTRPSQIKFEAPISRNLEICKVMKNPLTGHLNRQMIIILESLGVPHKVFLELQDTMKEDIDLMMENEDKARDVVNRSVGSRECSHITRSILSMIDEGMMRTEEPYLIGLLECKRIYALKNLKYKARIMMPKAFLLFGILDETGILGPGEIFVQTSIIISQNNTFSKTKEKVERDHRVHVGKAVITRNPCLHPGDIQMVTAVNVPELSHLRNCVVFSMHGERPLPNCLSGGDLDGDEYFVCFDERIFFDGSEESMKYDPPDRKKLDRPVEISDLHEFFSDFMINNRLGQIANLHMAFADYEAEGVRCNECVYLAQMHSKAVDFNKTGVPVTDTLPRIEKYPDFMGRRTCYQSKKILGKLYRRIELDQPDEDSLLGYEDNVEPMQEFLAKGFEYYMEEAVICRNTYNSEIKALMKRYDIDTEPEVITSNIISHNMNGRRGQDIRERVSGAVSNLIYNFRKNFLMGIRGEEDEETMSEDDDHFGYHVEIPVNEETKAKASAWYMVTYGKENVDTDKKRLLSFPWIVTDILLAIRSENQRGEM